MVNKDKQQPFRWKEGWGCRGTARERKWEVDREGGRRFQSAGEWSRFESEH